MSNFFSNCCIYTISRDMAFPPAEELEKLLAQYAFKPCGSNEIASTGWFAPAPCGTLLHHPIGKGFMLQHRREAKIIPPAYIREMTAKRIKQIQNAEGRPLKNAEKRVIKDDVIITLIPRAFTRIIATSIWVDVEMGRVWVDSSSSKRAEDCLALLRKTLGSLPVVPLTIENPVELTLTEWLRAGGAPRSFTFGEVTEMKSLLDDGGIVRCKKVELESDEIKTHLEAGKLVTKLALDYIDRVSFVVTDSATLTHLKFTDELHEQNGDVEEDMPRYDADMVLMTAELTALLKALVTSLGGEAER
ncbi:TPA: recombination-associated protein RdgC [Enterobacter cloacae]|nr:recombination-associated protein RdgC [Enterobacter cloacae]